MRQSAQLAAAAMRDCIQMSHPGVHEHQLAAAFEHRWVLGVGRQQVWRGPGGLEWQWKVKRQLTRRFAPNPCQV